MSLEVVNPTTGELDQAPVAPAAVASLVTWANAAQAAHEVACRLVETAFVPKAYRGRPGDATAAILAGLEMGLQPMAALNAFDVIEGRAAPRALTLRAITQAAGHRIELVESTATRCIMRGRRRDATEWQTVSWTIDRAKQLRLTGKQNWQQQPAAMLLARATSELCRLVAADAILGMAYSVEEIADSPEVATEPEALIRGAEKAERRTLTRQSRVAPEPDPATLEVSSATPARRTPLRRTAKPVAKPADEQPEGSSERPIDTVKQRAVGVIRGHWKRLGVTDRAERLWYTASLANRESIESTSDLDIEDLRNLASTLERARDLDALNAQMGKGGES